MKLFESMTQGVTSLRPLPVGYQFATSVWGGKAWLGQRQPLIEILSYEQGIAYINIMLFGVASVNAQPHALT